MDSIDHGKLMCGEGFSKGRCDLKCGIVNGGVASVEGGL